MILKYSQKEDKKRHHWAQTKVYTAAALVDGPSRVPPNYFLWSWRGIHCTGWTSMQIPALPCQHNTVPPTLPTSTKVRGVCVCLYIFNIYICTGIVRPIWDSPVLSLGQMKSRGALDQHGKTLQQGLHGDRSENPLAVTITVLTVKLLYIWRVSSLTWFI